MKIIRILPKIPRPCLGILAGFFVNACQALYTKRSSQKSNDLILRGSSFAAAPYYSANSASVTLRCATTSIPAATAVGPSFATNSTIAGS